MSITAAVQGCASPNVGCATDTRTAPVGRTREMSCVEEDWGTVYWGTGIRSWRGDTTEEGQKTHTSQGRNWLGPRQRHLLGNQIDYLLMEGMVILCVLLLFMRLLYQFTFLFILNTIVLFCNLKKVEEWKSERLKIKKIEKKITGKTFSCRYVLIFWLSLPNLGVFNLLENDSPNKDILLK